MGMMPSDQAFVTAALADKLKGSSVLATCAAPGLSATILQQTTHKDGGMGGAMCIMRFAQSAEDGSMPLIHACFAEDVTNVSSSSPGMAWLVC